MSNKLVYFIFSITLIIFIAVYIFVPTIEVKDYTLDTMDNEQIALNDFAPIYSGVLSSEEIENQYEGNIKLYRVWLRITHIFTVFNEEIINSDLSVDDYYVANKDEIEKIYGCTTKDEFINLAESFKELGLQIFSATVLNSTIEVLEDSIKFNIIVNSNEDGVEFDSKYKFYTCTIYNNETKKDYIFKIEPYLEVQQ